MENIILYAIVTLLMLISYSKDKEKSKMALKKAWKTLSNLVPTIIPLILVIGMVLALVTPDFISSLIGEDTGVFGVFVGLIVGAIAFMPGFVAFPLGANLLEHGAGYPQIAAFISSLMGVGLVSLGMEIKYFGKKVSIVRNIAAVFSALFFAFLIGGVL